MPWWMVPKSHWIRLYLAWKFSMKRLYQFKPIKERFILKLSLIVPVFLRRILLVWLTTVFIRFIPGVERIWFWIKRQTISQNRSYLLKLWWSKQIHIQKVEASCARLKIRSWSGQTHRKRMKKKIFRPIRKILMKLLPVKAKRVRNWQRKMWLRITPVFVLPRLKKITFWNGAITQKISIM